jgi:hypothetical protein
MHIMLLLWIIGILLMWAVARATLQQRNRTNIAGEYKATVELAASMRKDLSEKPNKLFLLSEGEIKERIQCVDGGNVAYTTSILDSPVPSKEKTKAWCKREVWWLSSLLVLLVAAICIWPQLMRGVGHIHDFVVHKVLVGIAFLTSGGVCGLSFSLAFGSTWRSRGLFTLSFIVLSIAPLLVCLLDDRRSSGQNRRLFVLNNFCLF